jgi:hypothetical protein
MPQQWPFSAIAGLVLLLAAAPVARADTQPDEIRLFLGVTHQRLDRSDAQVRAFIALQELLGTIRQKLPQAVRQPSRFGDVPSWGEPEDRSELEQQKFTHYLIAEPRVTSVAGGGGDEIKALEIKWHIGAFSTDESRALDGSLKERSEIPKRVILIPKLESAQGRLGYERAEFMVRKSVADSSPGWDKDDVNAVADDMVKVLVTVFPEMRSNQWYFIECIRDYLSKAELKGMNTDVMVLLSVRLQMKGWSPTVQLIGSQAEEICADAGLGYKSKDSYQFKKADFVVNGLLSWNENKNRVRPSLRVDSRLAEKRSIYVSSASEAPNNDQPLEDFCAPPEKLRSLETGIKNLIDYIRGHGLKAGPAASLDRDWKCNADPG